MSLHDSCMAPSSQLDSPSKETRARDHGSSGEGDLLQPIELQGKGTAEEQRGEDPNRGDQQAGALARWTGRGFMK